MNDFRRALNYTKPYMKEVIAAMALLGLVVVADLSIPRLVQVIIDEGVANNDVSKIINTSLLMIGASILLVPLLINFSPSGHIYSSDFESYLKFDLSYSLFDIFPRSSAS